MSAMRPGLPDPLIDLLGARWSMAAPLIGAAWFGAQGTVAFALADGTLAIAPAQWPGAARLQPRDGGGMELVPATAAAPPVSRAGVHDGPLAGIAPIGAATVLTGGVDGRLLCTGADGGVETLADFKGQPIGHVAAGGNGAHACAVGPSVHRFGPAAGTLDPPGTPAAMAFDPTGRHLAIAHPGGVTLWSSGCAPARLLALPQGGTPGALAWSSDGSRLITGLAENAAHGWRLPDGADIPLGPSAGPPLSLGYSPASDRFAASGSARVACWRLGPAGTAERDECGVASTVAVTRVACHPTRSLIAAGYENGAVLLCQPDSADILFVRAAGGGAIAALAWSATGAYLALGTASGEIGVVAFPEALFRDTARQPEHAT